MRLHRTRNQSSVAVFLKTSSFAERQTMDLFARYALVADDNPLIRMDAQAILMEAGFQVFTAAGFEDAAEILATSGYRIQLLFTDVQMPPGTRTGYDLARLCARDWPEIGILVASGTPLPEPGDMPERAMFLGKPFSADTVKTCIAQVWQAVWGRAVNRCLKSYRMQDSPPTVYCPMSKRGWLNGDSVRSVSIAATAAMRTKQTSGLTTVCGK